MDEDTDEEVAVAMEGVGDRRSETLEPSRQTRGEEVVAAGPFCRHEREELEEEDEEEEEEDEEDEEEELTQGRESNERDALAEQDVVDMAEEDWSPGPGVV